MALGDGIRRNLAGSEVSDEERERFVAAIQALDVTEVYPGKSYWDLQQDSHVAAHIAGNDVHSGPGFLGWHREICNRFEALLRMVDGELSLHYWDWTTDPRVGAAPLLRPAGAQESAPGLMGSSDGSAGAPFASFVPSFTRDLASPPPGIDSDATIVASSAGLAQGDQFDAFDVALQSTHDTVHSSYIRGTIGEQHIAFRDPFVFLLHANVDRLWALWQLQAGQRWRLDPDQVYGIHTGSVSITSVMEPWAGDGGVEPWVSSPAPKNAKHPSIVAPPCYDTNPIGVDQFNTEVRFNDVPEGETALRAARFTVYGCHPVTLRLVLPGPSAPYATTGLGTEVHLDQHGAASADARLWFSFTGQTPGTDGPEDTATIHCDETGEDFAVTLRSNTITRPTMAVMMALDQSASMGWAAGTTGATRLQLLQEAAGYFVSLVKAGNGVGLVRFDHEAYAPGHPSFGGIAVTPISSNDEFDPGRVQVAAKVGSHATNPFGATSVGAGIELAHDELLPVGGFEKKALLVFTDALENTSPMIADALGSVTVPTFAVGLGSSDQVDTAALTAVAEGTGGTVSLSDHLAADVESRFRLNKLFLQILAGVNNTDVVVDPNGVLLPDEKHRIPFVLCEADIEATVILMTDRFGAGMYLETPDGTLVDPTTLTTVGGTIGARPGLVHYRFLLPLAIGAGAHAGTWHAVLVHSGRKTPSTVELAQPRGPVRYSFNVHSWTNLRMEARLTQDSLEPGASLGLSATLSEYGVPVADRASVRAEVHRPDGATLTVPLDETGPGRFAQTVAAPVPGVYRVRTLAAGVTLRGMPFTREHLLTGAVLRGGDRPLPTSDHSADKQSLCDLLSCLLQDDVLGRFLERHKVNRGALAKCLDHYCRQVAGRTNTVRTR